MSAKTLYVATSNPGKLRDFSAVASAAWTHEFAIAPLPGLKNIATPPENEATFEGNARTKAIYYSSLAPGLDVLADDSGLEVDALGGEPGVRSARYATDQGWGGHEPGEETDFANNAVLLQKLSSAPEPDRTARYRCVLALARDGKIIAIAEGIVDGLITLNPKGNGGFGYDPLFCIPNLGKTMAEIDLETKNRLSHRGRALRTLLAQLSALPD